MAVQVVVDGASLTELDIKWFRKQCGVVSQVSSVLAHVLHKTVEVIDRVNSCEGFYAMLELLALHADHSAHN